MNGHVRLICCLMRVWTVRREAAPDVILCRASAEVPVRHLQHLYILCSPPSSPCLSLTLTSLWLLPLAVLSCLSDQHVCSSYTEAISFYMIKKKRPSYSACSYFQYLWFGAEKNNVTSFTGRCCQGIHVQIALGWSEDSMCCMSWCGLTLHSFLFCLFRPEANRSLLSDTKRRRTKTFQTLKCFTLVKTIKIIKSRLLATWKAWEEGKKTCMDQDKMVKLPLNIETRSFLWYSGDGWNELR